MVSYLILNGYLLLKRGQTVGKRALNIAIVSSKTGDKAPFWKFIGIRAMFFPLLFLVIVPALALLRRRPAVRVLEEPAVCSRLRGGHRRGLDG